MMMRTPVPVFDPSHYDLVVSGQLISIGLGGNPSVDSANPDHTVSAQRVRHTDAGLRVVRSCWPCRRFRRTRTSGGSVLTRRGANLRDRLSAWMLPSGGQGGATCRLRPVDVLQPLGAGRKWRTRLAPGLCVATAS